jgi:hypothetical protein
MHKDLQISSVLSADSRGCRHICVQVQQQYEPVTLASCSVANFLCCGLGQDMCLLCTDLLLLLHLLLLLLLQGSLCENHCHAAGSGCAQQA